MAAQARADALYETYLTAQAAADAAPEDAGLQEAAFEARIAWQAEAALARSRKSRGALAAQRRRR